MLVLVRVVAGHEGDVETGRLVVPGQPDAEVQVGRIKWGVLKFFPEIQQGHDRLAEQVDPLLYLTVVELDLGQHLVAEVGNRVQAVADVGTDLEGQPEEQAQGGVTQLFYPHGHGLLPHRLTCATRTPEMP